MGVPHEVWESWNENKKTAEFHIAAEAELMKAKARLTAAELALKKALADIGRAQTELQAKPDSAVAEAAVDVAQAEAVIAEEKLKDAAVANAEAESISKIVENKKAAEELAGVGFAPMLTASFDIGSHDRVDDAEIVGGVVRVTKDNDVNVGAGAELHYFFLPNCRFLKFPELGRGKWGFGPYVGVTINSNDNIIDTIAAGFLLGLRRDAFVFTDRQSGDSFNIGIGIAVDPDSKILGSGFRENRPPPNGETQVRFRTTDQLGIQVILSYQF